MHYTMRLAMNSTTTMKKTMKRDLSFSRSWFHFLKIFQEEEEEKKPRKWTHSDYH